MINFTYHYLECGVVATVSVHIRRLEAFDICKPPELSWLLIIQWFIDLSCIKHEKIGIGNIRLLQLCLGRD